MDSAEDRIKRSEEKAKFYNYEPFPRGTYLNFDRSLRARDPKKELGGPVMRTTAGNKWERIYD